MGDASTPIPINGSASADAPSSPVNTGEEGLVFSCAADGGKVIIRLNRLVQWWDMEPALAIRFAESLIGVAVEARDQQMVAPIILPGITSLVQVRR